MLQYFGSKLEWSARAFLGIDAARELSGRLAAISVSEELRDPVLICPVAYQA